MEKILTFDIRGDYAMFRRSCTTSSQLTYSIPTGTVIKGIIGAILGLKKDSYNEKFSNIEIGIEVLSNVGDKVMIGHNLLNTQTNVGYTQVKAEYIIDPKYRLHISNKNFLLYEELKKRIENNEAIYTPYLGNAYNLAKIEYVGETDVSFESGKNIDIDSVIGDELFGAGKNIEMGPETNYEFETIPFSMDNKRNLTKLKEVLFTTMGTPIRLKSVSKYYTLFGKNIVLLG